MNLAVRYTLASDFEELLRSFSDRHGYPDEMLKHLPKFWNEVLSGSGSSGVVLDMDRPCGKRIVAWGLSVFLEPQLMEEIKTERRASSAVHVLSRWIQGASPILSPSAIRDANSTKGLSLFVMHTQYCREYPQDTPEFSQILAKIVAIFMDGHIGYRLNEVLLESIYPEFYPFYLAGGYRDVFPEVGGKPLEVCDPSHPRSVPYLMSATREDALINRGTNISFLFAYNPPRFFFEPHEQETLHYALMGKTDDELARSLSISLSAVKKRWNTIYAKVDTAGLELIGPQEQEVPGPKRGAEKRRRLLVHLQSHREEMRPNKRILLVKPRASPT